MFMALQLLFDTRIQITATMITKLNFTDHTIKSYAIRKLTPTECFRLMGVRSDVINVMQSTNAQAAERMPGTEGKGKPTEMAVSVS